MVVGQPYRLTVQSALCSPQATLFDVGQLASACRLLDAALAVARNLARTRAGNKHALQAALADLPESFHVINA